MEETSPETVCCPYCAECIQASAVVCRFCNRQVRVPDAATLGRIQKLSPNTYWGGPEGVPALEAVASSVAVEEGHDNSVSSVVTVPPAVPSEPIKRKWYWNVGRDVFLNLGLTFALAFLATVLLTTAAVGSGATLDAGDRLVLQYRGMLFGFLGSIVAYTIAGCWGREPRSIRARRLRTGAMVVAVFDIVVSSFQTDGISHADATTYPVAYVMGSIVGSAIGTAIRCAIGYGLSLLFAKPGVETE